MTASTVRALVAAAVALVVGGPSGLAQTSTPPEAPANVAEREIARAYGLDEHQRVLSRLLLELKSKPAALAARPLYEAYMDTYPEHPSATELIYRYANVLSTYRAEAELYDVLKRSLSVSKLAARDPRVLIHLAFDATRLKEPEAGLGYASSALALPLSKDQRAQALLAKAVSLRDLRRMEEGQEVLSESLELAQAAKAADIVSMIADLRSPGHSMDVSVTDRSKRPPSSKTSPWLLAPIVIAFLSVTFWALLKLRAKA